MATSWVTIADQDDPAVGSKIVAAQSDIDLLDAVMRNPFVPYAITPMTEWLFDEVGYTPPGEPRVIYPPQSGRGFPAGR